MKSDTISDASFLCFDTIPECDGQTDGQTDGHICSGYTSACIARYANALVKINIFPYPTPISAKILGCSLWSRPMMLGSAESQMPKLISVKLFLRYSNACDHNPPTLQTDRQTNRQTTYHGNAALRYASHGKKCTLD